MVASAGTEVKALVTGIQLAQYAKRKFPHINVVMISGRSPPHIPQDAWFH